MQARIDRQSALLKSDRNIPPREGPFANVGFVAGVDGAEIDPALSLAAGGIVTIAAIPAGALSQAPTLDDFAATANGVHAVDPNDFETLQSSKRNMSLNAGVTRPLGTFSGFAKRQCQQQPQQWLARAAHGLDHRPCRQSLVALRR